ncbi:MAG: sugar transporter permease [Microbacteriaceae bacterium]|nr:sugar transporter permease [Microbacteriaceae bacterium]
MTRRTTREWRGWWFVGPFAAVFVAVFVAPVAYALGLSMFRDQLVGGTVFVGLGNYLAVFADPKFWSALGRVTVLLVVQVPIMLALALLAALAIDSARLRFRAFIRIAIFLPYAVPGVVAALLWGFMYSADFGLTGGVNAALGSDILQPLSPGWILGSIGNIVTWEFLGYNMLIFYAALRAIPAELYEAATLDGAGDLRLALSVKLPALRGAILIATIFSIIGSFQLFNEPNLLKVVAPNAISTYFTPNLYAYNLSFGGQEFNYAASVAIVMGLLTAVIAYVVQLRGSRVETR